MYVSNAQDILEMPISYSDQLRYHNQKLEPVSILMALIGYAIGTYGVFAAAWLCWLVSNI